MSSNPRDLRSSPRPRHRLIWPARVNQE